MYSRLLYVAYRLCTYLCWVAPFTFVFCLVYAVREAVNGGSNDIALALGASLSLLIIVGACVLAY